ncbi:70d857d5-5fe4-4c72-984c-42121edf97b2 [Sclerotinia trifoliorum]|uniref:70d857d5-5fe4-4c72-984c-42121edf97b2 n=1 Tax=Sclerotinia trifoliorum TaxID=28548 RepID=A0A8H2W107_9HELO|nr:70d857d5-5fe4-4c72-984c-42121edf97b2 [Sclerotinia trifoliorum]
MAVDKSTDRMDEEKGFANDIGAETLEVKKGCGWRRHATEKRLPGVAIWLELIAIALLVTMLYRQQHALGCLSLAILGFGNTSARPNTTLPSFVFDYAPLVWLDEAEMYFPSDMYAQILNTKPYANLTLIPNDTLPSPLDLENLDFLNNWGPNVYLTSNIDVTTSPAYLTGVVPSSATGRTQNAISCAVILSDHGGGLMDVFYMYFYAYNQGNTVFGQELGDHIGDWEHNMIRFVNGTPQAVWYSQHANGQAFLYSVVEKSGKRPIAYSARGSHANYAIPGTHDHTIPDLNLPAGLLQDYTSRGTLWDPILSSYFYTYDIPSKSFTAASEGSPVGAMEYEGKWGDAQYPKSDRRQSEFFGFWKFVGGPTGPGNKQLGRKKVCPDNGILCIVRDRLGP